MLAVEDFIVGNDLTGVRGHPAHRRDQTGFGAAFRLVEWLVHADCFYKVVPFELVRVRLGLRERPDDVFFFVHILSPVDAALCRRVGPIGDDRGPLVAVGVAGELAMATVDTPAIKKQFRAVGEGVFDRVIIKVLVHRVATIMATSDRLGFDRPGTLHPAAFVYVMYVKVAEAATTCPEEAVKPLDLIVQFADTFRFGVGGKIANGPMHPICPHGDDVTDLAVFNPIVELPAGCAVTAHQPHAHLKVLLYRIFGKFQELAGARAVHCNWFFHKDVDALLDGVDKMHPAKCRRRRKDHYITQAKTVHRLLIRVKANEFALLRYVHLFSVHLLQNRVTAGKTVLEYVSHGDKLDRPVLDRQGV